MNDDAGDSMRMKRAVVTGGSGFIGRHLVASLVAGGYDVHVLGRTPSSSMGAHFHQVDLLSGDMSALLGSLSADLLVHLAWDTAHGKFWNSPLNLDWVAASLRLGRAFHHAGGKRFVGVGTCFEYDVANGTEAGFGEDDATGSDWLYGVSKDATRRILASYCADSGISFAWARLFHLYGQGEAVGRLVPTVARKVQAGEPADCTTGEQKRDFMHAADAGRAIAMIGQSELTGCVNVASGQPVTIAEVAMAVGDLFGRPDLIRLGGMPQRAGEPAILLAKTDRLRTTGFVPFFNLARGLQDVFRPERIA